MAPRGSQLGGAGCGFGTTVPFTRTWFTVGWTLDAAALWYPNTATNFPPPTSTTPSDHRQMSPAPVPPQLLAAPQASFCGEMLSRKALTTPLRRPHP